MSSIYNMIDNAPNKRLMHFVRLETEVRSKAEEYLEDICEENIKVFSESAKMIALSVLEEYYLTIDEWYSSGAFKIEDEELFDSFSDFHDGYRAKMKVWIHEHDLQIKTFTITANKPLPQCLNGNTSRFRIVASVGFIIVVALAFFSSIWITLAAGLLVLGISYAIYIKEKNINIVNYDLQCKKYEMEIESEKERIINGVLSDLKEWLQNAQSFSDDLLNQFGIK